MIRIRQEFNPSLTFCQSLSSLDTKKFGVEAQGDPIGLGNLDGNEPPAPRGTSLTSSGNKPQNVGKVACFTMG
jgi:hypothetical protein